MHSCPRCGQACYCHGDIDDCEVETEEYSSAQCVCPCEDDWADGVCDCSRDDCPSCAFPDNNMLSDSGERKER